MPSNPLNTLLLGAIYLVVILLTSHSLAAATQPLFTEPLAAYHREFGLTGPVPPLVRWDSEWYWSIAAHGYTSLSHNHSHNIAFPPLYPSTLRALATLLPINLFTAGLLVSGLSLLGTCYLVSRYADLLPFARGRGLAATAALLAFPTAYIFPAMYSESLYLLLILCSLWFYRRQHLLLAALSAFAATLTRTTGLALTGAFLVMALLHWRQRRWQLLELLPLGAPLLALGTFALYSQFIFGHPWQYFQEKVSWFGGAGFTWPWITFHTALTNFSLLLTDWRLENFNRSFELPALLFALLGSFLLWRQKAWLEASFCTAATLLILFTSNSWGAGRYVAVLFPLFLLLGPWLQSRPWLWYSYLFTSLLWQTALLWNYVAFTFPSP
jgi:Gpi18-like mannosyltransferase